MQRLYMCSLRCDLKLKPSARVLSWLLLPVDLCGSTCARAVVEKRILEITRSSWDGRSGDDVDVGPRDASPSPLLAASSADHLRALLVPCLRRSVLTLISLAYHELASPRLAFITHQQTA